MSDIDDMDLKLAADAVKALPEWMDRAQKAEAKVAEYARKERVLSLIKKADQKQASLPKVDLMKCSESVLEKLEQSLDMIGARGDIQLGSPEGSTDTSGGSVAVPQSEAQKAAEALRDFTLMGLDNEA